MGEREICIREFDVRGRGRDRGRLDWVVEIESEVQNEEVLNTKETDVWKKHTIYKIPEGFVSDEKRMQAYKPQVVSIGPYHHGEKQLLPMEEHKRRAVRRFLVRTKRGLRVYREALRGVVQELMDSYKDLEKEWKDDEERFLQLMIFDGCFMIELLRTDGSSTLQGYDESDPIFSRDGMLSNVPRITRDMLMIENQIPLLVLKKLLSVQQGVVDDQDEQKQPSLNQTVNNMVLKFFAPEAAKDTNRTTEPPSRTTDSAQDKVELGLHALDVVRKSMIKDINGRKKSTTAPPSSTTDSAQDKEELCLHALNSMIKNIMCRKGERESGKTEVIWPATRLQEAGIKFRKSGSPSLMDIGFSPRYLRPTLSLPQLVVDDATESKFLNIIAFEHLHLSSGKEVSSFVCFMDNIIDSEKDVSLLSQNDIIKNFVGTDQAVADLFNGLSHDVSIDPASALRVVHQEVIKHCKRTWNQHLANLKHTHFRSPWSFIAFVAAAFALSLTVTQFVYTTIDFIEKH